MCIRLRVFTEGNDASCPAEFRLGAQPVVMRIIAIEDRDAALLQAVENFALRIGDLLDAVEEGHVDGFDCRDERGEGFHQL